MSGARKADFTVDGTETKGADGKVVPVTPKVKMRKIVIHPKGPEDSEFQPVGINGNVWLIRKGVEAHVPSFVLSALRNAVETHFVENRDARGDITYVDRQSPRFTVEVRE